jgi:hypothetical protein
LPLVLVPVQVLQRQVPVLVQVQVPVLVLRQQLEQMPRAAKH